MDLFKKNNIGDITIDGMPVYCYEVRSLCEEDFEFEINEKEYRKDSFEIFLDIKLLVDIPDIFKKKIEDYQSIRRTLFMYHDYRGCNSDASKEKKREKNKEELRSQIPLKKQEIIYSFQKYLNSLIKTYNEETLLNVSHSLGDKINLPSLADSEEKDLLFSIEENMKKLQEEIRELKTQKNKIKRNIYNRVLRDIKEPYRNIVEKYI